MNSKPSRLEAALLLVPSALLLPASWFKWAPIDFTEACEAIRHEMHRWFEEALDQQAVPWISLRGTPGERLTQSITACLRVGIGGNFPRSADPK